MITQLHFEPLKSTASMMPLRKTIMSVTGCRKPSSFSSSLVYTIVPFGGGVHKQLILSLHVVGTVWLSIVSPVLQDEEGISWCPPCMHQQTFRSPSIQPRLCLPAQLASFSMVQL